MAETNIENIEQTQKFSAGQAFNVSAVLTNHTKNIFGKTKFYQLPTQHILELVIEEDLLIMLY